MFGVTPLPRALGANVFASPEQIVRKSLSLAQADRQCLVSVAGPDSLAAMISLCRDGFDHVECARQATCSSADEMSDVLLIAGRQSAAELGEVVRRTCRLLRDGGVLVAQLERPADDAVIRAALMARGVHLTTSLFDLNAGCLVSHRTQRAASLRQTG